MFLEAAPERSNNPAFFCCKFPKKYCGRIVSSVLLSLALGLGSSFSFAECGGIALGAKLREVAYFTSGEVKALTNGVDAIKLLESHYPFIPERVRSSLRKGNFQTVHYKALLDINDVCGESGSDSELKSTSVPDAPEGIGCYYIGAIGSLGWHLRDLIQKEAGAKGMSGGALTGRNIYRFIEEKMLPVLMDVEIGPEGVLQFTRDQAEAMLAFKPGVTLATATQDMTGLPPSSKFMALTCLSAGREALYQQLGFEEQFKMIPLK